MSSLRPPSLGPIVGHTTSKSCRLWIRGTEHRDEEAALAEDRRTVGVITVLEDNGQPVADSANRTQYFRLHREFDRTGTCNLGVDRGLTGRSRPFRLEPDHTYRIRMGCLALDDAHDNDAVLADEELVKRLPPPTAWADDLARLPAETSEAVFRTFLESSTARLSFLLGSCRYPGILWRKKRSDRIFAPMFERIASHQADDPRFVLMVGDQIYADMFNRHVPIGLADTYQEFQDRYHDAFGSRNMRRLLRNLPAYMILDDHEIEDNWTQDRLSEDRRKRVLFQLAVGAYMSYQWSHGPRTFGKKLFYSFECGGFPFFVLDLRTQRFKDGEDDLGDNHLLGRPSLVPDEPNQLDHLCAWLSAEQQKRGDDPKFIVSPSVFVPNDRVTIKGDRYKFRSDSWAAFPATRRRLLDHIVGERIQNVVFLSGDVHCSNIARMTFSGSAAAERLKAFSIVSSAFYWPFPFADGDPADFVHDSQAPGQEDTFELSNGIAMDYTASHFTQDNNFCQVDVDRDAGTIEVQAFDSDGGPIHHRAPVLQLAS